MSNIVGFNIMFETGKSYSKKDIYKLLDVPIEMQRGSWDTGYRTYENDVFIFANINTAGRTGHDYDNRWHNQELIWFGKTGSHIGQNSIRSLLNPAGKIYIFTRTDSTSPFTFTGEGTALRYMNTKPVCIVWGLTLPDNYYPDEVREVLDLKEGATKTISVNQHERNLAARQMCIDYYGPQCRVCEFDFENTYGSIGSKFIHVHHLVPLSMVGNEYLVDPINDLIPVCPNCHAMLHRRTPPFSISDLKAIINDYKLVNINAEPNHS